MRRAIAVLVVASLGIVGLAGCGTAKVASSPQNTTAPLDKKISGSVPDRYRDQPLLIATDASLAPMVPCQQIFLQQRGFSWRNLGVA